MNIEQLLERLEIENVEDFQYYENFADLMEGEYLISEDAAYELFSKVDTGNMAEIIENYFEEVMESVPNQCTDVYALLDIIKITLAGILVQNTEETKNKFAEEITRFKNWFSMESNATCTEEKKMETVTVSLMEAITMSRLQNLGEGQYKYDFTKCMEYELEEYIVDLARLRGDQEGAEYDEYEPE